jgi:lipopolysaccharide transport system ATP-binding protein
MSDTVIKVENLSKKYIIRHQQAQQYTALRDVVADGVKSIGRCLSGAKPDPSVGSTQEEFWALKDVSFEVKQGDRIGIIGRNGAGKSTLLKILSRITEPTRGQIAIQGRVASLLEVGTGFHSELTGRENVYLNGAILGMSKTEIKQKFDEIVAFSEVENFLDTPVKHYSSGMYVRLAFAVAAHLETEVLIVDEVLAVGDVAFQKKCLGKMEDVTTKDGKTVLFVSHNLQAMRDLCHRGVVLNGGSILVDAPIESAIKDYTYSLPNHKMSINKNRKNRLNRASGDVRFIDVIVQNLDREERWSFKQGETVQFKFSYAAYIDVHGLCIYLALKSPISGEVITTIKHVLADEVLLAGQTSWIILEVSTASLRQGEYALYAWLGDITSQRAYDVVDENVDIPYLIIISDEQDPHKIAGYFSIPSRVIRGQIANV